MVVKTMDWKALAVATAAVCVGCASDPRDDNTLMTGTSPVPNETSEGSSSTGSDASTGAVSTTIDPSEGGTSTTGSTGADDSGSGPKFDLGAIPETTGIPMGTEGECTIPEHVPCDDGTADPFHAMGLGCPGELQVQTGTSGPATARGILTSFGMDNTFDPREGTSYAVIGTGPIAELGNVTPDGDDDQAPTHCNEDLGNFDPNASLPAPIQVVDVGGDCLMNPALVGTGDCSNTIQTQFEKGFEVACGIFPFLIACSGANDYVEMRFDLDVPQDIVSFSYDFAFLSTEWPYYYQSTFNDMYIGWLESEQWTGNISFDGAGNPISLNAGFLSITDEPAGSEPSLDGTCMRQHASTGWLTTTAGVTPGESITVVFAVFDVGDSILDSYVFLDNFQWGCDPQDVPSTQPEG